MWVFLCVFLKIIASVTESELIQSIIKKCVWTRIGFKNIMSAEIYSTSIEIFRGLKTLACLSECKINLKSI